MRDIVRAVYDLVNGPRWPSRATVPTDFKGKPPATPFLRVGVVGGATGRVAYSKENKRRLNGIVQVQIITESGKGQEEAATIAGELSEALDEIWLTSFTQTEIGSLEFVGRDPKDDTKYVSLYSVPFTYIGE